MDPDLEGLKPSLSGVLMCTAHLRIPVRTSTNQGPENGNLVEQGRRMDPDLEGLSSTSLAASLAAAGDRSKSNHQQLELEQIALFSSIDL